MRFLAHALLVLGAQELHLSDLLVVVQPHLVVLLM